MLKIEDKGMKEFMDALAYFQRQFPRESKQLMAKVGNKARAIVRKTARANVKRLTGNYFKSIKRGRVFIDQNGKMTVRVYHSSKTAPHAHLIERGHRVVRGGKEIGFTPGKNVFDKSSREIESQYNQILEKEFDKMLKSIR